MDAKGYYWVTVSGGPDVRIIARSHSEAVWLAASRGEGLPLSECLSEFRLLYNDSYIEVETKSRIYRAYYGECPAPVYDLISL